MATIADLSWKESSFLSKFRLFVKSNQKEGKRMRSSNRAVQAEGYSALSSTYYSIVGTGVSTLKNIVRSSRPRVFVPLRLVLWCLTWLPFAGWCFLRMLPLSRRVVKLIGYGGMSEGMIDIHQSILRLWRKDELAKDLISCLLRTESITPHTRGLLSVGLADIYLRRGQREAAYEKIQAAIIQAHKVEETEPLQVVRIYRHAADMLAKLKGDTLQISELRRKASELAEKAGAKDQILKLGKSS